MQNARQNVRTIEGALSANRGNLSPSRKVLSDGGSATRELLFHLFHGGSATIVADHAFVLFHLLPL